MAYVQTVRLFLPSQIRRTDHDFFYAHRLCRQLINLKLLLLSRKLWPVFHIKEFASKQADSSGVTADHVLDILSGADICTDINPLSALGNVLLSLQALQVFDMSHVCILLLFHFRQRCIIRLNIYLALITIHYDHLTVIILFQGLPQAYHGRNPFCPGKNCCMGIDRTVSGYKT